MLTIAEIKSLDEQAREWWRLRGFVGLTTNWEPGRFYVRLSKCDRCKTRWLDDPISEADLIRVLDAMADDLDIAVEAARVASITED